MRFVKASTVGAALLVGLVMSGCTSGSTPAKTSAAASSPGSTASAAPSGGSSTSKSTSKSPSTSTFASTSPSTSPTSSASGTTPPLSKFEDDPSVKVMRQFFYHSGRMINQGHYVDAELRTFITPFLATQMKKLAGDDIGRYYPGPLPFQPIALQKVNATNRTISGCLVSNGWAENKTTHRPAKPLQVVGAKVFMLKVDGKWLVNAVPFTKSVSCQGVVVRMQKWSQASP